LQRDPQTDFYGTPVPAYWMLVDEPGTQGSVANAEAWHCDSLVGG
jgi:hypothetical protein